MASGLDVPAGIAQVHGRMVLNTHLEWTPEFTIRLADGRTGRGAAPGAETPSVFEARRPDRVPDRDTFAEVRKALAGYSFTQGSLDRLLTERGESWGASVVYGVSVAFFEASRAEDDMELPDGAAPVGEVRCPRLLLNVLNGGMHAYTNPVACDFHEVLLVPRSDDYEAVIDAYLRVLHRVRTALVDFPQRSVGGNRVHDLGPGSNEAALALVEGALKSTGLSGMFGLMVDASAGDWTDGHRHYALPVTGRRLTPEGLTKYWLRLMDRFDLTMLEDPCAESDLDGWRALHAARPAECRLLGDNLTSTLPSELAVKAGMVDGVLLKPDQNGTVSGALRFAAMAGERDLQLVASHRSVETDTLFLVHLATQVEADYFKIGPFSDFSSVMRSNTLLRRRGPGDVPAGRQPGPVPGDPPLTRRDLT
ncbi:2-phospho-D-glycerate hydro-lyase [Streptomyces albireticuli]|uniref:Enolase n=1 Tax=Streptomyces albireticuli TaxID=1940 RepID=A0A1Z2LE58_9ACTN|nr:enolase C-terminal domain-like protein [Streptomyces albireticuli]ARZ72606.1 2-phospho-D-glycerate hydro-lyase [Streptomyces albireticuli]